MARSKCFLAPSQSQSKYGAIRPKDACASARFGSRASAPLGRLPCLGHYVFGRKNIHLEPVRVSQAGISLSVVRILLDGAIEVFNCLRESIRRELIPVKTSLE